MGISQCDDKSSYRLCVAQQVVGIDEGRDGGCRMLILGWTWLDRASRTRSLAGRKSRAHKGDAVGGKRTWGTGEQGHAA